METMIVHTFAFSDFCYIITWRDTKLSFGGNHE